MTHLPIKPPQDTDRRRGRHAKSYKFRMPADGYLYLLAWDHGGGYAMAMGQFGFDSGSTLYSDATHWQYQVLANTNDSPDAPAMGDLSGWLSGSSAAWSTPLAIQHNFAGPHPYYVPEISNAAQAIWTTADDANLGQYVMFRAKLPDGLDPVTASGGGLAGRTVILHKDSAGSNTSDDISTVTDAAGNYTLPLPETGVAYSVSELVPSGWAQVNPANPQQIEVESTAAVPDVTHADFVTATIAQAETLNDKPVVTIQPVEDDVTGTSVQLFGSATDDDGPTQLRYHWHVLGRTEDASWFDVNNSATATSPTVTFPNAGYFTIELSVSDRFNDTSQQTVMVHVIQTPATLALWPGQLSLPLSTADQPSIAEITPLLFDQFGIPMAVDPAKVTWSPAGSGYDLVNGPGYYVAPLSAANGATRLITASFANAYDRDVTASTTVTLHPADGDGSFDVRLSSNEVPEGTASVTAIVDTHGGVVGQDFQSYWFDRNFNGQYDAGEESASSTATIAIPVTDGPDHGYFYAGVIDNDGVPHANAKPDDLVIDNVAPTVTINGMPDTVNVGDTLHLTSTVYDPSPADVAAGFKYLWSVKRNGADYPLDATAAVAATLNLPITEAGDYIAKLSVTDKDGGTDSLELPFSVLPQPTISISTIEEDALEASQQAAVVRISRDDDAATQLAVNLFIDSTSSASEADFVSIPATVQIPAGSDHVDISLVPIQDNVVEGEESLVLGVSPSPNYTVSAAGPATIYVDDVTPLPSVSIQLDDDVLIEGTDEDSSVLNVSRTGDTDEPLSVDLTSAASSLASRLSGVPSQVIIPSGSDSVAIPIQVIEDGAEYAKTVFSIGAVSSPLYRLPKIQSLTLLDANVTYAQPAVDLDYYSDLDDDGLRDNTSLAERAENQGLTYIPTASFSKPAKLALTFAQIADGDTVTFDFNPDQLQLFVDSTAQSPITGGQSIAIDTLTAESSHVFYVFCRAIIAGQLQSPVTVSQSGSTNASSRFASGGLIGVDPLSTIANANPFVDGFDPGAYAAYLYADEPDAAKALSASVQPNGVTSTKYFQVGDRREFIVNKHGDWLFQEIGIGWQEVSVFDRDYISGSPKKAGDELFRATRVNGGEWQIENNHGKLQVVLPAGNRGDQILKFMNGTQRGSEVLGRDGWLKTMAEYVDVGESGEGFSKAHVKDLAASLSTSLVAIAILGTIVTAAHANPMAANPQPVIEEIAKWRRGESSEIFVKLQMDAYTRDLFKGMPDSVLDSVRYYILYVWDLDGGQ